MTSLRVGDLGSVRSIIRSCSRKQLVVILAPNFEERSTLCCEELLNIIREECPDHPDAVSISWVVFTLQGRHSPTFLDAIKAVNVRKVIRSLQAADRRDKVVHKILEYPIDQGRFVSELALLMHGLSSIDELIVDYSAFPRNLLSALIEEVEKSGGLGSRFPSVGSLTLLYAWSESYPKAAGPELLGEVVGHFSRLPLRSLLEGRNHAEIVIFAAGTTHDTFSLLESVRDNGMGNQIGIHLVNFVHTDNLLESRLKLRNHYTILRDAPLRGVQVRYVFTVRHALAYMRDVAQICAQAVEEGSRSLLAIGSFGPKPIAVGAQFVVQEFLRKCDSVGDARADVLNSRGSQYLSPYSLGSGKIGVFDYQPRGNSTSFLG